MNARLIGTPRRAQIIEEPTESGIYTHRIVTLSGEVKFSDGKRYRYQWEVGTQHASLTNTVTTPTRLKRRPYTGVRSVKVRATGKSRHQVLLEALNEYEIYWSKIDEQDHNLPSRK